ncbi:900_t:CDS:2 [Ambispora gerdemannii]|uniref:900_t:CDS:1 n=1 Tax=Ambispora gerdemannii TaxID=144530 RepID=A0A9N9B641_9GLOM|nr:900_t:CDS:2 [Ambispora gerdemannii]
MASSLATATIMEARSTRMMTDSAKELDTEKLINLFSFSTGVSTTMLKKRESSARATFKTAPDCSLTGEFSFRQLSNATRINGQINSGFSNPDPSIYKFEIHPTKKDPSTPIKVLNPKFTINVPPGGSSPIQLTESDIALQSGPGVKNVLNAWLRILNRSGLLCSARIVPA